MGCDGWCHDVIVMDRGTFVNSVDISPSVAYRSHVIDVDSSPVAWREAGSGPVAVFLHGLGGGRTAWRPQLEVLSEVRRCVAWDAPGYGASDPVQDTSFDAYARAALSVIDTVSPGEAVDLVGMSFGGMIAQYATALAPERIRSLTLLCTSPKFGLDGTDAAAPLILPSLVGPNGAHVLPEAIAAMGRVPLAGLLDSLSTIASHDSRALLPAIVTPTLVLVGELDDETPVTYGQAIVDLLPNGRLEVIPGVGHLLNLEAEDAVNTAIARHWQEVTP
jgi:pimeloyl-ACP methyl ester carboxylesterase